MRDCDCQYRYEYNTAGRENRSRDFLGDYISKLIGGVLSPISSAINEQKEGLRRETAAAFIKVAGWIFLLNGLALLINNIVGVGRWLGYMVLGMILLFVAMFKK
jgi:hypothetical protein